MPSSCSTSYLQLNLDSLLDEVRPLLGNGKVADYIPALASIPGNKLGIAICDIGGNSFYAGDAQERFSIQSISKVLSLALAFDIYGEPLWSKVGREPSGQAFNSLIQLELEQGIPRNPFINAGAIRVCDLLASRLAAPKQRFKELLWDLCGEPGIKSNKTVAKSEMQHSARNASMGWLMKSFNNFDNDVSKVLGIYFHACAMEMSCVELAQAFSFLANQGVSAVTGQRVISTRQSKQINALLATCGLYDQAGDFAYRVGLPGKSGVGGGIVAIVPGECSICVWSPELNQFGNSLAGSEALSILTTRLGKSIF